MLRIIFYTLLTLNLVRADYKFETKWFRVPLDHFGFQRNETFEIKYLENEDNWDQGGGPIFFYTGNEGQIEVFAKHTGFMWEIAEQFRAKLVFAEHRYYGASMPFGNKSLDNDHIGYLSSAQALADYADLINYLQGNTIKPRYPVIAFGGSYGGMLAAYFRMKYPHIVNGAIAASAPVHMFSGMAPCGVFNRLVTSSFRTVNTNCSRNIRESWSVIRVNVIHLTLHHLNIQSYGISNHGYFHYKTHICSFIDRYWQSLFGAQTKQKKNWVGTIAGVLSVYNKLFFKSGSAVLGETGWWKLLHNFSPAVAAHIIQEIARDKPKVRPRNQLSIDKNLFLAKVTEMGYKELINVESNSFSVGTDPVPCKKRRVDSDELSGVSSTSFYDQLDSDSRNEIGDDSAFDDSLNMLTHKDSYSEMEFRGFEFTPANHIMPVQSDSSSIHSFQQSMLYYDSDSRSGSEHDTRKLTFDRPKKQVVEEKPIRRESLFSTELNSVDTPWEDPLPKPQEDLVEMSQYEEIQLLKKVEGLIPKVRDPNKKAYLCRLRAKLALRRLKRHKHLPLFDLDKQVKLLGGYMTEDPRHVTNAERVLDRFQRSYLIDNLCGTIASTNYGTLLLSNIEPTPFRSLYSGATLKPYIRRDGDSAPTWLKLTDELLRKTNRHIKDYEPPPRATIDYSYVKPQHIAAVNNLCAQFFWPGIDLTEALQYPEFSCVVTYKRLVIGCAFLVPDVGHNEAYISFVLTRPEWRNAKIATFMLYHLLQTCTGKDVTLHVSPTNSAIFLYQKFGFKVEELVQDFYEKYYDIEFKGCRHALFLRLVR